MLRALLPKMVNAPIQLGCCTCTTVQGLASRPRGARREPRGRGGLAAVTRNYMEGALASP